MVYGGKIQQGGIILGCKVTWILLQIMKDNGVTFTFPLIALLC